MEYHVKTIEAAQPGCLRLTTDQQMGFLLVMRGRVSLHEHGRIGPEHLCLCKEHQVLRLEYTGVRVPLKALWVRLNTQLLAACSTPQTDIAAAFAINPAAVVAVRPRSEGLMLLKSLASQLERLQTEPRRCAGDVLERATQQMFLALVLQAFVQEDPHHLTPGTKGRSQFFVDEVFRYIRQHLTEEITLQRLEQEFYVSRSHLLREFKKHTGQTVHSYIVQARLDASRTYLEQGKSVAQASQLSGFTGYNHFFKAFRRAYGMTPRQYAVLHTAPDCKPDEAP